MSNTRGRARRLAPGRSRKNAVCFSYPLYAQYTPSHAKYLQVHRWHLMRLRPEEEPLATAELIKRLTLTGTKQHLREEIRALRDAGYAQFAAHIRYGHATMVEEWAEVLAGV